MKKFEYKAFISYSHADSAEAAWLQRALETYRVPSRMVGKITPQGKIPRRIGAVFRDQSELPAGDDLSSSLTAALDMSEWLIVICSPAARQSRWVDIEIECFKASHDSPKILCLIVDGEPFASKQPGQEHLECFPAALDFLEQDVVGHTVTEPIAADSRQVGDGKQLAKLKLISGLLGVGLNTLIRRDSQRRHRSLLLITVAALVGMLAFAFVSLVAVDARRSEELRRAEAEDLIEFMLSDLRDRLQAVGRLDVLDAVGQKAVQYYSNDELSDFSASSLGRRARAFHLLGEVDELKGSTRSARAAFDQAFRSTRELLARTPADPQRIFNHAQSVFWIGYLDWRLGDYAAAEASFIEYIRLSRSLVERDPANPDWQTELGSAYTNMGVYVLETNSVAAAVPYFQLGQSTLADALMLDPGNDNLKLTLANAHAWLADAYSVTGDPASALVERRTEQGIYMEVLRGDPGNQDVNQSLQTSHVALAQLAVLQGDLTLAAEHFTRAQHYGEDLMSLDPDNTFTMLQSATLYTDFARVRLFEGHAVSATEFLARSDELVSSLLERDSGILEWTLQRHTNRVLHAQLLARAQHSDEAVVMLDQTARALAALAAQNPGVHDIQYLLADCYLNLAFIHESMKDQAAATRFASLVVTELQPMAAGLPPAQLDLLAQAFGILGERERERELLTVLEGIDFRRYLIWQRN